MLSQVPAGFISCAGVFGHPCSVRLPLDFRIRFLSNKCRRTSGGAFSTYETGAAGPSKGELGMPDLAQVTDHIRKAVGDNAGLGKTVKLDFGPAGKIYIDGVSSPNQVSNDDKPADATISMSWADFEALVDGRLDPMMAFMQGKMKIQGDMMLAQKLAPILKR
jgi:putative sterol carrier protein